MSDDSTFRPGRRTRPIQFGSGLTTGSTRDRTELLLHYMLIDEGCMGADPSKDVSRPLDDLDVAGAALLYESYADPKLLDTPGLTAYLHWPKAKQTEWLGAVIRAADACRLEAFPAPPS